MTDHQRRRLADAGSDFERGTVGAVCLDANGQLVAGTSTGGRRGQRPGRVGDTPLIGAGTWADARVAISCTGEGEAFIRAAAAAHQVSSRARRQDDARAGGRRDAEDVREVDGVGGLIAVAADGTVAMPFTTEVMNRAIWRDGEVAQAWV